MFVVHFAIPVHFVNDAAVTDKLQLTKIIDLSHASINYFMHRNIFRLLSTVNSSILKCVSLGMKLASENVTGRGLKIEHGAASH